MNICKIVLPCVLAGLFNTAYAAPAQNPATTGQVVSDTQVLSDLFVPKTEPQGKAAAAPHRYRVSGIIDVMEYDGPRLALDWLAITDWLERSPVNVIIREMNKYLTRSEPKGSIRLELPDGAGGVNLVTIWQTSNSGMAGTPMEYFGQRYFEAEFETSALLAPTKVTFDCHLLEGDGAGDDDKICDSKVDYGIGFSAEGLSNKILFKLKSGDHRTINTMMDLYNRIMGLPSTDNLADFATAAQQLVKDASGVWIQNLNMVRIDADASQSDYAHIGNGNMSILAANVDEIGPVEPYGQVKIIPHASYVKVDDILTFLADYPNIADSIPDLPPKIRDIELAVFTAKEPARDIFSIDYESDQRGVSKANQKYYFDEWLPVKGENLIVFNDVWEKDDAGNRDDCFAKGYGLGFDRISLGNGGQLRGCKTEDSLNRLEIFTNTPDRVTRNKATQWVLETKLFFTLGDSGDPIEPYGNLRVELASVQPGVSSRLIWQDDYRNNDSESLPDNQTRFPRAIHFSADEDLASSSTTTLSFIGSLYEGDSSGDDRYYDPDVQNKQLSVPISQLSDGLEHTYELPREANNQQTATVTLRLRKLFTVPAR